MTMDIYSFGPTAANRNLHFFSPSILSIFMLKFRTPLCGLPGVYVTSEQQRVLELIFHLQRLLGFHRNSAYGIEALEVKQSARKFQKLSTLLPPKLQEVRKLSPTSQNRRPKTEQQLKIV